MRQAPILLVAALVLQTGCLAFPAKRSPQLSKPRVIPEPADDTVIRLVVHDESDKPRNVASSLRYARKKFPYIAASGDGIEADYTIELGVEFARHACCTDLSGLTFALIPDVITRRVFVTASVKDADDRVLGVFQSTGKSKRVIQLHLVWVLPFTLPFIPVVEQKMWNHTFRDALIMAGEAITDDQRATDSCPTDCAGASGLTGLERFRTGDLLARHFSQPFRSLTDFDTSGRP